MEKKYTRITRVEGNNNFVEDWISEKLMERLLLYKKRYPSFDERRVFDDVKTWDSKMQKFSPYMEDGHIKSINEQRRFVGRIYRLAELENH